jgi:hypothetical protein
MGRPLSWVVGVPGLEVAWGLLAAALEGLEALLTGLEVGGELGLQAVINKVQVATRVAPLEIKDFIKGFLLRMAG